MNLKKLATLNLWLGIALLVSVVMWPVSFYYGALIIAIVTLPFGLILPFGIIWGIKSIKNANAIKKAATTGEVGEKLLAKKTFGFWNIATLVAAILGSGYCLLLIGFAEGEFMFILWPVITIASCVMLTLNAKKVKQGLVDLANTPAEVEEVVATEEVAEAAEEVAE